MEKIFTCVHTVIRSIITLFAFICIDIPLKAILFLVFICLGILLSIIYPISKNWTASDWVGSLYDYLTKGCIAVKVWNLWKW